MNSINRDSIIRYTSDASEVPPAAWERFLENHVHCNPFQSPTMYDVFAATPSFEATGAVAIRGSEVVGVLQAVVQREGSGALGRLTARTIVWGGPLVSDGLEVATRAEVADGLVATLMHGPAGSSMYIEIRNFHETSEFREIFRRYGFAFEPHLNFRVDTRDRTATLAGLSATRRRQIRKSTASGAEVVEASDLSEVRAFHALLVDLYTRRVGKPLPPWEFFAAFFETSCRRGEGAYLLVKLNGEVIGGMMCPLVRKHSIYEWYVVGQDDLSDRRIHCGVLATWAGIDFALDNAIPVFDFMGAGKPDVDYGVRDFKSKFGGQLVQYGRWRWVRWRWYYELAAASLKLLRSVRAAVTGGGTRIEGHSGSRDA